MSTLKLQPDLILHENVSGFHWPLMLKISGWRFGVACREFSPLDMGFPIHRPRVYSVMHHLSTLNMKCPYDGPAFEHVMFANVVADAGIFYLGVGVSSEHDIQELRDRAARYGRVMSEQSECGSLSSVVLPGPQQVRLAQYKRLIGKGGNSELAFLCNLQQRPSFMKAVTRHMPTLLCNSLIYNTKLDRPTFSVEYFASMGVPTSMEDSDISSVARPLHSDSESHRLSTSDARLLCGNGMHVAAVGGVFLWALSAVEQLPTQASIMESDV